MWQLLDDDNIIALSIQRLQSSWITDTCIYFRCAETVFPATLKILPAFVNLYVPDSPTSSVWSVRSITALATPMAFLILLRSATAPTSSVSLSTEKTLRLHIPAAAAAEFMSTTIFFGQKNNNIGSSSYVNLYPIKASFTLNRQLTNKVALCTFK